MKRSLDPEVRFLQAIADPARLAILRELAAGTPICACDFTSCCDVAQPTVSHHLKVLRDAGWVTTERRGTWIYYSLAPQAADRLRAIAAGLVSGPAIPAGSLAARSRRLPVLESPA